MELKSTSIPFSRIRGSDLHSKIFTTYAAISFTSNQMFAVSPRRICQEMKFSFVVSVFLPGSWFEPSSPRRNI